MKKMDEQDLVVLSSKMDPNEHKVRIKELEKFLCV